VKVLYEVLKFQLFLSAENNVALPSAESALQRAVIFRALTSVAKVPLAALRFFECSVICQCCEIVEREVKL
jgi:high-affinity K+ transport system ATPase subunit B